MLHQINEEDVFPYHQCNVFFKISEPSANFRGPAARGLPGVSGVRPLCGPAVQRRGLHPDAVGERQEQGHRHPRRPGRPGQANVRQSQCHLHEDRRQVVQLFQAQKGTLHGE